MHELITKTMHIGATERRMIPDVISNSNAAIRQHLSNSEQKPLFVDMGSNLGQGFEYFSQYYSPDCFDYWFVEPNPHVHQKLTKKLSTLYKENQWKGKGKLYKVAISNFNGTTKLFGLVEDNRGKTSEGASIIKNHNSIWYESNQAEATVVTTKRATDLIAGASNKYKTIVVKMDIEGAEYDVLEDLIASNSIDKINHLYVEFHSKCVNDKERHAVRERETELRRKLGSKLFAWI